MEVTGRHSQQKIVFFLFQTTKNIIDSAKTKTPKQIMEPHQGHGAGGKKWPRT